MPDHHSLIDLELAALSRWCNGDPDGFLAICADDVSYFDPFISRRIDGLAALSRYYASLRGKIFAKRHEMRAPLVQAGGELATLSFQFVSWGDNGGEMHWNCSETYRLDPPGWRIIHTHWSLTASNGDAAPTP